MSIKAISYVLGQTYDSASQKLMMVSIANICDDEGVCYSGVKYICANHNNISTRSGSKLLSKLEEDGHLSIVVGGGIDTSAGKTNRYFMVKYRQTINLSSPKVGTRADQLETKSSWIRPVKNDTPDDGDGDDSRPVKNDTPDLSLLTGDDLSSLTGNPSVDPSVDPFPLPDGNGGDPPNDSGDGVEVKEKKEMTSQQKASIMLGIYCDEQDRIVKDKTGHKSAIDRSDFRQLHWRSFHAMATHDLNITLSEFREYLTFILGTDWFKKHQTMPSPTKMGAKLVMRVANNRKARIQSTTDDVNSSWSDYTSD